MINRNLEDPQFYHPEKGVLVLTVNRANQSRSEIDHIIQFLNTHPEITTIQFFKSFIKVEFAEALAAMTLY